MKFKIAKLNENIVSLFRKLRYAPQENEKGEFSGIRYLGTGNYPRFHLYIKQEDDGGLIFNLHLDQKRPSYKGTAAHSGEYEGKIVKEEAERIMKTIKG